MGNDVYDDIRKLCGQAIAENNDPDRALRILKASRNDPPSLADISAATRVVPRRVSADKRIQVPDAKLVFKGNEALSASEIFERMQERALGIPYGGDPEKAIRNIDRVCRQNSQTFQPFGGGKFRLIAEVRKLRSIGS